MHTPFWSYLEKNISIVFSIRECFLKIKMFEKLFEVIFEQSLYR